MGPEDMKLIIDTDTKEIVVEAESNFEEVLNLVQKLAPEDWKSYTLVGNALVIEITYSPEADDPFDRMYNNPN
jgi:hypothetical protein